MPGGIGPSLFGLGARYQVWSDCQDRSRVSGAQAGFTIAEYLIHSTQQNKDVSRELILSILVDTFFARISMPKLQHPEIHNISAA